MNRRAPFGSSSLFIAAIAASTLTACDPPARPHQPARDASVREPSQECQIPTVDTSIGMDGTTGYFSAAAPNSERIADIPEYHDCQRLVERGVYGPLAAVYATYWGGEKMSLTQHARLEQLAQAMLRDTSRIRDSVVAVLRSRMARSGATAVESDLSGAWRSYVDSLKDRARSHYLLGVSVMAWGGNYDPLSIKQGWNCVYVRQHRGGWEAIILNHGENVHPCEATSLVGAFGAADDHYDVLEVKAHTVPGARSRDFPGVARWEWDADRQEQYLAFTCDSTTWCEVGPRTDAAGRHSSEQGYRGRSERPLDEIEGDDSVRRAKRVAAIKGWFDHEQLAPDTSFMGGSPTGTWATIFPARRLDVYTIANDFKDSTWVRVASIALSESNQKYLVKWNFESDLEPRTVPLDQRELGRIDLCRGARCGAGLDERFVCNWPNGLRKPPLSDRWWARISYGEGTPVYRCVVRTSHENRKNPDGSRVEVPGTARWRWLASDQTVWVRCDQGCCEVIQ